MKLAIVSDVHGNLVAFEAVLADLAEVRPDLIVHGGDLAYNGPQPAECVDRLRELGWPGVMGNTDEALQTRREQPVWGWGAERLGAERLSWLQALPPQWRHQDEVALVHAVPGDLWRLVPQDTDSDQLRAIYGPLGANLAVYCHIHEPFVREMGDLTVANSGSVGLPNDGDPRSAYLLIDDGQPAVRRVVYDVERAVAEVLATDLPSREAVASTYRTGRLP